MQLRAKNREFKPLLLKEKLCVIWFPEDVTFLVQTDNKIDEVKVVVI